MIAQEHNQIYRKIRLSTGPRGQSCQDIARRLMKTRDDAKALAKKCDTDAVAAMAAVSKRAAKSKEAGQTQAFEEVQDADGAAVAVRRDCATKFAALDKELKDEHTNIKRLSEGVKKEFEDMISRATCEIKRGRRAWSMKNGLSKSWNDVGKVVFDNLEKAVPQMQQVVDVGAKKQTDEIAKLHRFDRELETRQRGLAGH